MSKEFDQEEILNKIRSGIRLTFEEERFYLAKIVGMPKRLVDSLLAINANTDPYILVD